MSICHALFYSDTKLNMTLIISCGGNCENGYVIAHRFLFCIIYYKNKNRRTLLAFAEL